VTDDLVEWLRLQLDDDERWARAASQAYPYADPPAVPPTTGVHWRWVAGDDWHTVTPDPVADEFVANAGYGCNLATVETWRSRTHEMPQTYANEIVEMDASAAGHIVRWDPARVLREVEAKRRIVDSFAAGMEFEPLRRGTEQYAIVRMVLKLLALPYSDRPGFREEWKTVVSGDTPPHVSPA
jgi:hypothetical protein